MTALLLALCLGVGITLIPGVPGGAVMAAVGVLQGTLGFDETAIAFTIARYIAVGSFGTATNMTGDGAIAAVLDKLIGNRAPKTDAAAQARPPTADATSAGGEARAPVHPAHDEGPDLVVGAFVVIA